MRRESNILTRHSRATRAMLDRRAIASVAKTDRQAAKLGSLIDAAAKLAERIRIAAIDFDLPVSDKMREASSNTYGTQVMLEEARRRFSLRSGRSAHGIDYRREE